jgi:hypothetical protein
MINLQHVYIITEQLMSYNYLMIYNETFAKNYFLGKFLSQPYLMGIVI